ncbi:hypothetical protein ES705_15388 [subsurface metagenome]
MEKIEIDKDKPLNPGDVVELHYKTSGGQWMKATEAAMVEWAVERRKDFNIINIDYWQPRKVILTVQVQKTNPEPVTVAVICGAIAIAALAVGWMFQKAYLVSKTVSAQVLLVGLVIVAVIVAFIYLRK